MKITSQEEYGLRILLRIAKCPDKEGMTIQVLAAAEGLSIPYVAKLTRMLRMEGFINSTPGNKGGYILARPAELINVNEVLKILGGSLFEKSFCSDYSGILKLCTNSVDCSIRSLWQMIQVNIDQLLDNISLRELINSETKSDQMLSAIVEKNARAFLTSGSG
jgi:Rrf2 family transcriptional regulator, iron-sulfur cluster assembly transcription factor